MNSNRVGLASQRARLEREGFLSLTEPRDALAVYYALYHDPSRTQLQLHFDAKDKVDGFVVVCQTGFNLFQPTVSLRARNDEDAVALLREALHPGRPYYIVTTPTLGTAVRIVVGLEREEFNRIYRFSPHRYRPEINVLVQPARAPDGSPRLIIRSRGQIASEAGINWRSPHFSELFVRTEPWARGRHWGRAVVTACANTLIQAGVQPLYMVTEENEASIRLAESVGFVDTGAREFAGAGVCREIGHR
jgi:RimJ/RimL family protein N-acetyltransferase